MIQRIARNTAVCLAALVTTATAREPVQPASLTSATVTVTYTGKVPKFRVADNSGVADELLIVDRKTRGLQYAVVWLERLDPAAKAADADAVIAAGEQLETAAIDQIEERFVPRLIAVRSGQPVKFSNSDKGNHNVRSASLVPENQFNKFTPMAGSSFTVRFHSDRKNRPTIIGCDIHAWMRAVVYAFDHDRFAVTSAQGQAVIQNVPPGKYRLSVRQPDAGLHHDADVTIVAGQPLSLSVKFDESQVKQ